jgi:hypothetical protein
VHAAGRDRARRTLVIGLGLVTFLAVSVFPAAFAGVPHWAQPLTTSPLVLATLVALFLNLVFRIGIRRTVATTIDPARVDYDQVRNFVERNCAMWGARRDVTTRAEFAVLQAVEAIVAFANAVTPITCESPTTRSTSSCPIGASHSTCRTPGPRRTTSLPPSNQTDKATASQDGERAKLVLHFRQ